MRGRLATTAVAMVLLSTIFAIPASAAGDSPITDQLYVRHDGGTDPSIARCNSDDPDIGGANLQQDEPSVAINPTEPSFIVAGANDYCFSSIGFAWQGIYTSNDGGTTWIDSLIPGYPEDRSLEGQQSPTFGRQLGASDPVLDWDNQGNLYFGFIALNFAKPNYGDVLVATFHRDPTAPLGIDYLRTSRVDSGTPGGFFTGHFNDKPAIKVDDWHGSPNEGNVYYVYDNVPPGYSTNQALFSRSTDGGVTFSKPIKLNDQRSNPFAPDVAVAPDGTIYVIWRQLPQNKNVTSAIRFVKSTDGGLTFSKAKVITTITGYDRFDSLVSGGFTGECGDGPFQCVSGFSFARIESLPQLTVDESGKPFVTWEQVTPATDNGDTYLPDGQARVVVVSSADGGLHWTQPLAIDPQPLGHQFWPNIEVDHSTGQLAIVYYDSRSDASYSSSRPPGNLANGTSICGTPSGSAVCDVLNAFIATSPDGVTWSSSQVSTIGFQPAYETHGGQQLPFLGDYLGIDAAGGVVFGSWTDNRDVIPGIDVRESEQDGFDVLQCRASPTDRNTCRNGGGGNQNVYGAALP